MNDSYQTYKDVIDKKGYYIATPIGISMLPLIRETVDTVKLVKPDRELKKYDVVLYQRPQTGVYVLHRIIKVRKDSYDLCGDNQVVVEHGVKRDWIIGVMEGFFRDEEYIPITDEKYIKYSIKRVKSRKRRYLKWIFIRIKNKLKHKKGNK